MCCCGLHNLPELLHSLKPDCRALMLIGSVSVQGIEIHDAEASNVDLTPGQPSSLLICRLLADGNIWLVRAQIHRQLCHWLPESSFQSMCTRKHGGQSTHFCQGHLSRQLVELGAVQPRAGRTSLISHAQAREACKVRLLSCLCLLSLSVCLSLAGYEACCSCAVLQLLCMQCTA